MSDTGISTEHAVISKWFSEIWKLDTKTIDDMELEFMTAVKDLMSDMSIGPDGETSNRLDSCYDAVGVLVNFKTLVEQYQKVFHIVHTTHYWQKKS